MSPPGCRPARLGCPVPPGPQPSIPGSHRDRSVEQVNLDGTFAGHVEPGHATAAATMLMIKELHALNSTTEKMKAPPPETARPPLANGRPPQEQKRWG